MVERVHLGLGDPRSHGKLYWGDPNTHMGNDEVRLGLSDISILVSESGSGKERPFLNPLSKLSELGFSSQNLGKKV